MGGPKGLINDSEINPHFNFVGNALQVCFIITVNSSQNVINASSIL